MYKSILPYMLQHQLTYATLYLVISTSENRTLTWRIIYLVLPVKSENLTLTWRTILFIVHLYLMLYFRIFSHIFYIYTILLFVHLYLMLCFRIFFRFLWVHCCDVSPLSIIFIWYLILSSFCRCLPAPPPSPPLGSPPPSPTTVCTFRVFLLSISSHYFWLTILLGIRLRYSF